MLNIHYIFTTEPQLCSSIF